MRVMVRITPQSNHNEITRFSDGVLRIKIAAPPIDGKANAELCRFLGKKLDLPPSSLVIVGGLSMKQKILEIPLTLQQLADRLAVL